MLQPTTLEVQFHKCLVTDDPLLPKSRLVGQLPSVALNITGDYNYIPSLFIMRKDDNKEI